MTLDALEPPIKVAILRPDSRISVFFRHEAANVKNQMTALELPGNRTHHGGHVIAGVQNIDAFAPHHSKDGPGARRHIVNCSGQGGPLMIFKVMPAYSFGAEHGTLPGKFVRRPGFTEARLESQETHANTPGLQLT